jgi:hypothetical protein
MGVVTLWRSIGLTLSLHRVASHGRTGKQGNARKDHEMRGMRT